jgi:hypothetical protein
MFKKLIVLMLAVSIFTVQAQAASNQGLKAAFDELNYSLEVEWDQKNLDFKSEQMKKFTATIRDLQAKGLTSEQLLAFVKAEVKNDKVAKDLDTAFSVISINKMSPTEANNYILETMKASYSNGASWNAAATTVVAALVVIAIIALVVSSGGNVVVSGGYSCTTYNDYVCDTYCDYYGCWDDCYYVSSCY